ncbi:MAG: hypothetical protein DMD48_03825 [Gemmatimonadetes bacterium]|nr:MAG: hypothetical protein DMD48_03825 [Gemmatimonadota bacterium]
MRPRSITLLCVASLLGCGTDQAPVAADSSGIEYLQRNQQEGYSGRVATLAQHAAPAVNGVVVTSAEEFRPLIPPDAISNMVIRTATASVEVDSLEAAIVQVKDLAIRLGGYVANSGIEAGRKRLRQASMEVKIPAGRFDDVVAGLTPIGRLETINVSAQDVGEEYVDVTARMENARRLERRFIELLATRAGRLKDVLDVEQALARVREEIERYEGRMRYLRAHTAMSTLSITVHEPLPVVGSAGRSIMGEAFRAAWRNFVVLVSLAVQSLGVVIPLGAVAVVVWVGRRRVMKQRAA